MSRTRDLRDPGGVTDAQRIAELEQENANLRRQVAELTKELAELRKELEEWKRGHRERRRRRSSRVEGSRRASGRGPGRPWGAQGSNRPVPEKIHSTVVHAAPTVCDCGGRVEPTGEEQSTVLQDIPRVEVQNTRHVAPVGRCVACGKRQVARLPGSSEQGEPCAQVQLGSGIQALSIALHFEHHVPLRGVTQVLDRWFSVEVSASGLSQMFDRLGRRTAAARNEILERLRHSPVVGFDETSHRQDGYGAWLWLGRTDEVSYFHVDRSRGGHVFAKILGEGFVGVLCSDFYSVYASRTDLLHGYCNAHTVREARKNVEISPNPLNERFRLRLSDILAAGQDAQKTADPIAAEHVRRRLRRLIDTKSFRDDADVARLQDRLDEHFEGVLRFVTRPDVPMTNNASERDIRPAAVHRKVSGGTRSEGGSNTYGHWLSITQTLHKNDLDLRSWVENVNQAYLLGKPSPSVLSPPPS